MNSLDVLRTYTAHYDGAEYDEANDTFLPHEPINAVDAVELVRKWQSNSVLEPGDKHDDLTWSVLQRFADDYGVPIDEFIGAVHYIAEHNGAYAKVGIADQIGCAMGEVLRVLSTFNALLEAAQ